MAQQIEFSTLLPENSVIFSPFIATAVPDRNNIKILPKHYVYLLNGSALCNFLNLILDKLLHLKSIMKNGYEFVSFVAQMNGGLPCPKKETKKA